MTELHEIAEAKEMLSVPIEKPKPPQDDINTMLEQQIQKAMTRLERIKDAYESGIDSLEEYKQNKQRITAEIEKLKSERVTTEENTPEEDFRELQEEVKKSIEALESQEKSEKEKNEIARGFIKEIIKTGLDGKEFNIFYRK